MIKFSHTEENRLFIMNLLLTSLKTNNLIQSRFSLSFLSRRDSFPHPIKTINVAPANKTYNSWTVMFVLLLSFVLSSFAV